MKILIVDDQDLEYSPDGDGEVIVKNLEVSWDKETHTSVQQVVEEILAINPDAIFLDHTLGFSNAKVRGTGKDIAMCLREKDFKGKLISSSSEAQSYCDAHSGKVSGKKLSWLLQFLK